MCITHENCPSAQRPRKTHYVFKSDYIQKIYKHKRFFWPCEEFFTVMYRKYNLIFNIINCIFSTLSKVLPVSPSNVYIFLRPIYF